MQGRIYHKAHWAQAGFHSLWGNILKMSMNLINWYRFVLLTPHNDVAPGTSLFNIIICICNSVCEETGVYRPCQDITILRNKFLCKIETVLTQNFNPNYDKALCFNTTFVLITCCIMLVIVVATVAHTRIRIHIYLLKMIHNIGSELLRENNGANNYLPAWY